MGYDPYVISSKVATDAVVCLYPDIQQDDVKLEKVVSSKTIQWARDFKQALVEDALGIVKQFIEVGLLKPNDMHLFCVYEHKSLNCMRYLLELRLQWYDSRALVKKCDDNFFAFLVIKRVSKEVEYGKFDTFLKRFEEYFWDMRFLSNFESHNLCEQIHDYNEHVVREGSVESCIDSQDDYRQVCLASCKHEFHKADSLGKFYILDCARMFKHDSVLRMVHFKKDFRELSKLNNVRMRFT